MPNISRRTFIKGTTLGGIGLLAYLDNYIKNFEIFKDLNKDTVINNTKKRVFITIDDGPTNLLIPYADELEKYGHKGIFFFIGNMINGKRKEIVEILDRQHQIGNHSWRHPFFGRLSISEAENEVLKTDAILRDIISFSNQDPNQTLLFRYPYGMPVQKKDREQFSKFLSKNNYFSNPLMWDVDTNDLRKNTSVNDIVKTALNTKENKVILLHEKRKTFQAFKGLFKKLYEEDKVGGIKT